MIAHPSLCSNTLAIFASYREAVEVQPHFYQVGEPISKFRGQRTIEPIPVQSQNLQLIQTGQRWVDIAHGLDIAKRASQIPAKIPQLQFQLMAVYNDPLQTVLLPTSYRPTKDLTTCRMTSILMNSLGHITNTYRCLQVSDSLRV
jgi:hypothetical protein